MDITAVALQGLELADVQLDAAATRIATAAAASPDGVALDVVDLSAAVVALMSAKNQALANIGTLKTAEEVQQTTIDLMA